MPDIPYLLAYADTLAQRLSGYALKRHGLTLRQYGLLAQLRQEPELTASELARQLGITRQSLHEMASGLERAGLLERQPGASGRTRRLVLSSRAPAVIERARRSMRAVETHVVAGLTEPEARALRHLLAKLLAHATDDEAWTADLRSR